MIESTVDIVLLLIAAALTGIGIRRGLSGELTSLISLVGGGYCAFTFSAPTADFMIQNWGFSTLVARGAAITIIFFAVFFITSHIGKILKKYIRATNLTLADRVAGAITGLFKAYLVFLFIFLASFFLSPLFSNKWARESAVMSFTAKTMPAVLPYLSEAGICRDINWEEITPTIVPLRPIKNLQPLPPQLSEDNSTEME